MDSNIWTKLGDALPGGLAIGVLGFLILLALVWILLPFAVFGIKHRLERLADLTENVGPDMEDANDRIKKLVEEVATLTAEVRKTNQILATVHNVKFTKNG